ncbi:MAG: DUF2760 domain-containing protein [Thiohalocapsa sp.]|jgi:hypothetical protein|uniref:DUF2760 domain-containing protein n=1 Tax=Thiohalocapsa sp. TaxID=2497641 RepID=UPI0025FC77D2|nr:DUF2760 domain-containing protein [Thiohalocapsa sp.]MCG6942077.1 DUF2760 domain-containing protein [Thiohalocapsa sp.]
MTETKPSIVERLRPLQHALQVGLRVAWRWLRIAAAKTWIVLKRLPIATYSFVRALADADYAHLLTDLYVDGASTVHAHRPSAPAAKPPPLPQPAAKLQEAPPDSALVLLGLLQKEGRFVDFLQEQITGYSDQEIGAAARVVHDGCQQVLKDYISIAPVRSEAEGSRVTLERGFDASAVRPIGNVVGEPPFTGALVHRGWRAAEVRLPKVAGSRDVAILAPAEVEL